ncbi:AMP-binding protein [Sinomonas atrocyanea]|uniref:AMP-binding protein n=1 Tax=Sinomonas atrocyanea TaxID=37927 RepID=UPI00277E9F6A|nr:AMP-binding protein [Sinomonas atrocyanea]MDQ0260417.1 cyclohexanecarboxylate-CoA ligase [Sinomonas atrocyanea]MDR6622355.1 cyclohexanecarboxylate-CoA ligase [Sinomonas atrocyanea]
MSSPFEMLPLPQGAADFRAKGYWKNRLLLDYFDDAVAADPDKIASIDAAGPTTYREMAAEVEAIAAGLISLGVEAGDTVSIQLPNRHEWIVAHLAAERVGAVTNALIPIYRDREIEYMASKARAKVIFIPDTFRNFDYVAMIGRLRGSLPQLRHAVVLGTGPAAPAADGFLSWADLAERGRARGLTAAEAAGRRPDPDDLALVMFTSGTTGRPKGAMHSHNTVLSGALPWPDRLGMDSTSVIHMASTFGHLTGYLFGVALPIMLGATGVFQEVWQPAEFVELVEEHGIQHTSGATPFLQDILTAPNLADHDVSSLARFCCMGAPIPRAVVHAAKEKLPGLNVFGGWGQTECCLVTMGSPEDPVEKVLDSDGRVLPGMELRLVDYAGEPVPTGTEGRIQIRGSFLFRGYLEQLDATLSEFDGEWFDTGDLGTQDEDSYVRLAGRTKDIIMRGGENVPVAYVENVLYEHPRVAAVALVAVPHPRLQEIGGAVVQLNDSDPFTLEDLRAFLEAKGLAKPYWPEILKVVPELPRTPSGKIQKYKIRQELSEEFSQEATA